MYNLVIGIDISKSTLDASLVRTGVNGFKHDSFLNNQLGFDQLIEWLNAKVEAGDKVLFCMEHTGYYGHSLCAYLSSQTYEYAVLNPVSIKRSMGLRRSKSDKADSKVIALYGLKFQEEIPLETDLKSELLDLQLWLSHRKRLQEKELSFQRQEKHLKHCLSGATAKFIVGHLSKQKNYFKKQRKAVEAKLDEFIMMHPRIKNQYDLLQSIPGVGPMIALNTIVYTHNFEQISDPRKFSCYCGVAPFKHESGSSIRKATRISYFGNKKMKSLVNFGAMNAVKYDPQLKAYYQKKVKEGKSKMSVLNAVRNKLIHRMYATIKRGTPYVLQQTF